METEEGGVGFWWILMEREALGGHLRMKCVYVGHFFSYFAFDFLGFPFLFFFPRFDSGQSLLCCLFLDCLFLG